MSEPALAADQRHSGETTHLVEVLVDIERIEGLIEGSVVRLAGQAALDLLPSREEVGCVALVKRLGQLGQHDSATRDFGSDHAGGVTPVELTDAGMTGGEGVGGRRGRGGGCRG